MDHQETLTQGQYLPLAEAAKHYGVTRLYRHRRCREQCQFYEEGGGGMILFLSEV